MVVVLNHQILDGLLFKGNSQKQTRFQNEQISEHFPNSYALSPAKRILAAHSVSFLSSFPSNQPMNELHSTCNKSERCVFPWGGYLLFSLVPWGDRLFWIAGLKHNVAEMYVTGNSHAFQIFMAK